MTFNTYGAPIQRITRVDVEATADAKEVSTYKFHSGETEGRYYQSKLTITPKRVDMNDIVKFRIWRQTPNGAVVKTKKGVLNTSFPCTEHHIFHKAGRYSHQVATCFDAIS